MAVNKVVINNETQIDLTADTVDAAHLAKGFTAHDMKGEAIVGTMDGGSIGTGIEFGFNDDNKLTLFKTHNMTSAYSNYNFNYVLPENFDINGIINMAGGTVNNFQYFSARENWGELQSIALTFVDEVVLPDSLEEIDGYWFCKAFVKKITFGKNFQRLYGKVLPWYSRNPTYLYCTFDFSKTLQIPVMKSSTALGWANSSYSTSSSFQSGKNVEQIIVPDNLYDDWIKATNWASYASYIVKASEVQTSANASEVTA